MSVDMEGAFYSPSEGGLRSGKRLRLSPQSFGQMMRNPIYVGRVESPDYGISTRGDFEPVVDEATFYRAEAVLDGRVVVAGPGQRNHPDFRSADSCVATCAVARSLAAGRWVATGITPSTTVSASVAR